jgi:uncharacterized membrane protein YuzA (DUF378 family)
MIAIILLVVGGLNWLVLAVTSGWDIGQLFGGQDAMISRIIYILVGLSAIYEIFTHKANCRQCASSAPAAAPAGDVTHG